MENTNIEQPKNIENSLEPQDFERIEELYRDALDYDPEKRYKLEDEDYDVLFETKKALEKVEEEQIEDDSDLNQIEEYQEKIKAIIVTHHTGLVKFFLNKFLQKDHSRSLYLHKDDLHQEAVIGLLRAIELYDNERDIKFTTYASFWIKQAFGRWTENNASTIRIPIEARSRARDYFNAKKEIEKKKGREATKQELAARLETPRTKIEQLERTLKLFNLVALDQEVEHDNGEPGKATILEYVRDPQDGVESKVLGKITNEILLKNLPNILDPREYQIIYKRFGLNGDESKTLQEIGDECSLTRERIRQLETRALKKIKEYYFSELLS